MDRLTAYLGVSRYHCAPIHANASEGRPPLRLTELQYEQLSWIYEPTVQFLREHGLQSGPASAT